jgi:hypothetical protein
MQPPKSLEGGLLDSENAKFLQSIEVWLLSLACPAFFCGREAEVRFCLFTSKEAAMMDFSGDAPFIFKSLLNFYYAIESPLNPPKGDF